MPLKSSILNDTGWTGARVKALRQRLNWSQEELARHGQISFYLISRWETGRGGIGRENAARLDALERNHP
jgi:transcriptional regulator with XRE-family HTH domain